MLMWLLLILIVGSTPMIDAPVVALMLLMATGGVLVAAAWGVAGSPGRRPAAPRRLPPPTWPR